MDLWLFVGVQLVFGGAVLGVVGLETWVLLDWVSTKMTTALSGFYGLGVWA
jgi:hypothetical protein